MKKGYIVGSLLAVAIVVWAQLPTVPNTDFPTFRTNMNNSLQKGANITIGYSNPSWITSLAWSKITGAPSTIGPTGPSGPSGPTGPAGPTTAGSVLTTRTVNHTQDSTYCANTQPFNGSNLTLLLANPIVAGTCNFGIVNLNTSTALTIDPNGLTINGTASTFSLAARSGTTAQGLACWSDAANGGYKCWQGVGLQGPVGPTGPGGGGSTRAAAPYLNYQGTLTDVSGNGTLFTYTIPANTLGATGCITFETNVTSVAKGSGSPVWNVTFGATTFALLNQPAAGHNIIFSGKVCNTGATNSQALILYPAVDNTGGTFVAIGWGPGLSGTAAIDTTGTVVLAVTVTGVSGGTNTTTPGYLLVY